MTDERVETIRVNCARLRRRMSAEGAFQLLLWCEELLAELDRWRPRQGRMDVS